MAAEETRNPGKDIPKALIYSFITLALIGFGTLTVAAGVGGDDLPGAAAPLVIALQNVLGSQTWIVPAIALFSIAALIASFHAIVLAYSRQAFALARAGYFPKSLSLLNKHRTPTWGLVIPGVIGFVFVIVGDLVLPDAIPVLVTLSVMLAAVSYVLMMVAAIVLRKKRPDLARPYRAPGGVVTMVVALLLALLLIPAALWGYPLAFITGVMVYAVALLYYFFVSRHRVGNVSVEEELARVEEAEAELEAE
jgi:ethanolamine permease